MDKRQKVFNRIIDQGILPSFFHPDAGTSIHILKSLYHAGIRAVEYTNYGKMAIDNFLQLRRIVDKELPQLYLGAGSIKNKIAATEFINEGADFIISPGAIKEVANLVHGNDLLWIPTCMTTTEIAYAEDLGGSLVKLFPMDSLGPAYVSVTQDIFPDLFFMPTGTEELTEENLEGWFQAGISVVGLGGKLVRESATVDYATIEASTKNTLGLVQKLKKKWISVAMKNY